MGVTSLMDLMSNPLAASARIADSRPAPGPLTLTSMVRTPCSCASCAAFCAATCAANGVPLREPLNPMRPALDHASTLPTGSVMDTIVLLNVAAIDATPCGTFFFSFFFVPARRAPAFGAFAVVVVAIASCSSFFVLRTTKNELLLRCFLLTGDRALARSLACARVRVRPLTAHRQSTTMPHSAVAVDLHQPLDIEANVLAEVALDFESVRNHLPDLPHIILGQILDARVLVDTRFHEDLVRRRTADAEDVS